jgi:hypothetical protein
MADDDIESENWDIDEIELPQGGHEANVNNLIQRNIQILRAAEEKRETDELTEQFYDSVHVTDAEGAANTTRWNNLSRPKDSDAEYSYVQSDPKKIYVTNISYRVCKVHCENLKNDKLYLIFCNYLLIKSFTVYQHFMRFMIIY